MLAESDIRFVREAAAYLESPPPLLRLTESLSQKAGGLLRGIPLSVRMMSRRALLSVGEQAMAGVPRARASGTEPGPRAHVAASLLSGGAGGPFGWSGLLLELPLSTAILLRSIADIAAATGADLRDRNVRRECLAVFGYGAAEEGAEPAPSPYVTLRMGLTALLNEGGRELAGGRLPRVWQELASGAPALTSAAEKLGARYNLESAGRILAKFIPYAGALAAAWVNAAFAAHFNRVARYHFGLRRLEQEHGSDEVRRVYDAAMA